MRTWLIDIRKNAGLSQSEVARRAGMSQGFYAAVESGIRGKPLKPVYAKSIAQVLEFDWVRFYE